MRSSRTRRSAPPDPRVRPRPTTPIRQRPPPPIRTDRGIRLHTRFLRPPIRSNSPSPHDAAPAAPASIGCPHGANALYASYSLGAVEQADDRGIDVPRLIRSAGPDANLGFGGMDSKPWPTPPSFAHELAPGRRRREDATHSLSKDRQEPRRHMAVLWRGYHVPDRSNLIRRQSVWR